MLNIYGHSGAHTPQTCQAANHNGLVGNTGASQFSRLATFLSLSLSIISVPHCTLCILLPFAVAGAASWVCRCCWSHWAAAQQLANPTKLLSCSARVHLSFCLLQPPVRFWFFLVIIIIILAENLLIQNSAV